MHHSRSVISLVVLAFLTSVSSLCPGQIPQTAPGFVPQAPPTPPSPIIRPQQPGTIYPAKGNTLYSIGQPTDEEQLYLEYLNRSRTNATAEGIRLANTTDPDIVSAYAYFPVDLSLMQAEFSTNPPVPPLAMNAQLMTAARLHSGDMFTNVYQGHVDTNGATLATRVSNQGYSYSALGENVFSYAVSVPYGHAGFDVDWGNTPGSVGGMQNPPGHRNNIHSSTWREVGVGVVDGNNTNSVGQTVGPQLVTQDFGLASSPRPFITGVVYYDFNGNGFYDLGEGIGGVRVDSPGSAYYAITADSGGYALPVSTDGTYLVTFGANGLTNRVNATISSLANLKVDFVPIYSPPVISGPNPAVLNQANAYTFTTVGGATSYDWQRTQLAPYTTVEGAENGLGNMVASVSGGYSAITTDEAATGTHSFHLANLDSTRQTLTLNVALRPSSTSQLTFAKLLGYAGSGEISRAQISVDDGSTWQDVWTQPGSNTSGDANFSTITVPLASYSGKTVRIRFVFEFVGGSYFGCADPGCGLYLDNIAVSNATQASSPVISSLGTATSFAFTPTNTSAYLLQVRAHINSRTLPWNTGTILSVAAAAPVVQLSTVPVLTGGQVQLTFTVANYVSGMTFQLWKTTDLGAAWAQDTTATLTTITPNSTFRFTTAVSGAKAFYKVSASY